MADDNTTLTNFYIDRLAALDSVVTFLIDCLNASENFDDFRARIKENLAAVPLDNGITRDSDYFKGSGYLLICTLGNGERGILRHDDGAPIIYDNIKDATTAANLYEKFNPEIVTTEEYNAQTK